MALTPRNFLKNFGAMFGPGGAVLGALAGATDPNTGEKASKGLFTSKTIQGGIGLGTIPVFIFPLIDDAMGSPWNAWAKLILMVAAFAWLVYGRAVAKMPLGPGNGK